MAVMLGLPWLASAISSLFSAVGLLIVKIYAIKFTVIGLVIAAMITLTLGMSASLEAIIDGLQANFPATSDGWKLFVPDNFNTVLSAVASAKVIHWIFSWQIKFLESRIM